MLQVENFSLDRWVEDRKLVITDILRQMEKGIDSIYFQDICPNFAFDIQHWLDEIIGEDCVWDGEDKSVFYTIIGKHGEYKYQWREDHLKRVIVLDT